MTFPNQPLPPAALWIVPAECPNCGAPVDQATAGSEASPACSFCHQPLPVQAAHPNTGAATYQRPRFQLGAQGPPVDANGRNRQAVSSASTAVFTVIPGLGLVAGVMAIIYGFLALSQIRKAGGAQKGTGFAAFGIIFPLTVFALWAILIAHSF